MNVSSFFKHWSIVHNPFLAEEARHDDVFTRVHGTSFHPDFPKVLGAVAPPASAVVFGQKGSGKTAIRLQLAEAVETHNRDHPDAKTLVIAYDDLNPVLDRFVRRVRGKTPLETLRQLRLLDHIDGFLSVAVPELVDALLGRVDVGHVDLGPQAYRIRRKLDPALRQDWMILQAVYDRADQAPERTRLLRSRIRYRRVGGYKPLKWLSIILLGILAASVTVYGVGFGRELHWPWLLGLLGLAVLTTWSTGRFLAEWFRRARMARQLSNRLRILNRSAESFRASLNLIPWPVLAGAALPVDDLDDRRYAMLERLRRAVVPFGFTSILVLIDRIDEPTLVNGETEHMKAVVWPLFNSKLLQQEGFAFKMMLPLELRHELRRQSSEFFQAARLDKQNLIERLSWSGATLYDLCNARLNACLEDGAEPRSLKDLFDDSVTRQDIVDALDQMRQPRDAFKLMYQIIQQHCTNTTEEESNWRIPRLVLDQVRRDQTERLEALQRGVAPA